MGAILAFLREASFDAETTRILGLAYDKACLTLNGSGNDAVREQLARQILSLAQAGERDVGRLCSGALAAIGMGQERTG